PMLLRLLQAAGKKPLDRKCRYGDGRLTVLSHLVTVCQPGPDDTPERFAEAVKAAVKSEQLDPARILQLAFLAPQGLRHVEHYLGWSGLAEGVWWFLAHMPYSRDGLGGGDIDDDYDEDFDDEDDEEEDEEGEAKPKARKLSPWERHVGERTPLSLSE